MINRTTVIILLLALVSGSAGFLAARHYHGDRRAAAPATEDAVLGKAFPALAGERLDGSPGTVAEFGGRVLLVNFWATWCAPCRREMPDLMALQEELVDDQATVVGVALDFPDAVRGFVDELGIDYPILIPEELAGTRILRDLGNSNGLLPFSVVVDAQGTVRDLHLGELSRDEAAALITKHLPSDD